MMTKFSYFKVVFLNNTTLSNTDRWGISELFVTRRHITLRSVVFRDQLAALISLLSFELAVCFAQSLFFHHMQLLLVNRRKNSHISAFLTRKTVKNVSTQIFGFDNRATSFIR